MLGDMGECFGEETGEGGENDEVEARRRVPLVDHAGDLAEQGDGDAARAERTGMQINAAEFGDWCMMDLNQVKNPRCWMYLPVVWSNI